MGTYSISLIRLLAITLVFAFRFFLQANSYLYFVALIGLAHYLGAFIYSAPRATRILKDPSKWFACAGLGILCLINFKLSIPGIILYFGIHHIFSEVYCYPELSKQKHNLRKITFLRLSLHAISYSILAGLIKLDALLPYGVVLLILILVFLISYWRLVGQGPMLKEQKFNLLVGDFAPMFLALLILFGLLNLRFGFVDVILYHFLFWLLYPLLNIEIPSRSFAKFLSINLVSLALVVFGFSLARNSHLHIDALQSFQAISHLKSWGYLHITTSFALSNLNPFWIRSIFNST